jgi:uncharacterized membrane protein YsdA (DUF1294 family)
VPSIRTVALAYAALTLLTLVLYGWDKLQARRGGRRVPETTLHLSALVGGFAGAWLGMRAFRHKTQKPRFALVVAASALLHGGFWGWRLLA